MVCVSLFAGVHTLLSVECVPVSVHNAPWHRWASVVHAWVWLCRVCVGVVVVRACLT
eukprot:m.6256 g.6256  ORF g.6256 m.6256 type:complete len:57 (+) comp4822_c0_seq1:239-409(+)